MMQALKDLPHRKIVEYLRGEMNADDLESIQTLREADPATEFFFELVDKLKRKTRIKNTQPSPEHMSINHSQLNQLLLRILSGSTTSGDEQRFIDALQFAPIFYDRLQTTIPQITPELAMVDAPELAEIEMLDDDQILPERILKKSHSNGTSGALTLTDADLKGRIDHGIRQWWNWLAGHPGIATAGAAILLMIVLMPAAVDLFRPDPFSQYVYDDKVPYEYRAVIFRTPSDIQGPVSDFKRFQQQFQMAMADYMMRRYEQTITRLESLQQTEQQFSAEEMSLEIARTFREYYFYLGISRLALSRSETREIPETERGSHQTAAIHDTRTARTLAEQNHLADLDREIYFLALAYSLNNQKSEALAHLELIEESSTFFGKASTLREKLANDKK